MFLHLEIKLKPNFDEAIAGVGNVLMKKGEHKKGLDKLRIGDGVILFNIENGLSIH